MAKRVDVASVGSLDAFRSALIIYLDKAGQALGDIGDTVSRTRQWIQGDQRMYWVSEHRRRRKLLEQAEAELYNARMSTLQEAPVRLKLAVRRAKESIAEAEQKIRIVKMWSREFDSRVMPLAKKIENLQAHLDHEMPNAVASLNQILDTLAAYAENRTGGGGSNPNPETAVESGTDGDSVPESGASPDSSSSTGEASS